MADTVSPPPGTARPDLLTLDAATFDSLMTQAAGVGPVANRKGVNLTAYADLQAQVQALGSDITRIATYAAMRLYAGSATTVFIDGRTSSGDGAHGVFYYDASDTTTADNDGTVLVATGGKRWKRKFEGSAYIQWFGAISILTPGFSTYESTSAVQAALTYHSDVSAPPGVFLIDPVAGVVLTTGRRLCGAGKNKTIFVAKTGGGTLAQLAAYSRGSVFRRQFSLAPSTNPYVTDVYLADFAVVLTHPSASITTTAIQIGIDLRNITRSIVERVHVGNIVPLDSPLVKAESGAFDIQGYGIVVGNVSGLPAYAGGEVNTIRDCSVWGGYKLITQDDLDLSPLSSAHATAVIRCDLQAGHHLLVQESRYATGVVWRDNTLQSVRKQSGNVSTSYVARIEGYNIEMSGGYFEAGNAADYLLRLGSLSKNCKVDLLYYSATNAALITDEGVKNEIRYFENSGSVPGGVDSLGPAITTYNKVAASPWIKFHWDGSAIVTDGKQGIASVSRTGVGDYTLNFSAFPSDDYSISVCLDTNASGHGGVWSIGSHSASSLRLFTYAQNGATTTQIDPRFVWVRLGQ